MTAPDDLDYSENWHGGSYELAINLGPRDNDRLAAATLVVWSASRTIGCFASDEDGSHRAVPLSAASLEQHGHLCGVAAPAHGGDIVCGVVAIREDDGDDWLDYYLPLGALAARDPRVGTFPFGKDGGAASRAWREPLDAWLGDVGTATFAQVPFAYAAIGFEASGMPLEELDVDSDRYFHVLRPVNGVVERLPVTRWDFGVPG